MSSSAKRRSYVAHVTSWRFVVTMLALFAIDLWLEHTIVAQRATLGGFDTASERVEMREASRTAVIAISSLETAKYFSGKRPIPADSLARIVTRLLRIKPAVLVVDIFTDGPGYSDSLFTDSVFLAEQDRVVWARAVDTTTSEALPILSGVSNPPGRSGLASILVDEDRLVRRFRPRYASAGVGPGSDEIESLPLAAANAYVERGYGSLAPGVPSDTGSIALRTYVRDPPFYLLDDVLTALPSLETNGDTTFTKRIVVLGFIDGSDQVLTARGARAGPEVVADAIETLLDQRGVIIKFPAWAEWLGKILLALLVGFIHFRLSRRLAAVSMVALTVFVVYAGFVTFAYFGYWTNFVLIVVGMWIEQIYEGAAHSPPPASQATMSAE